MFGVGQVSELGAQSWSGMAGGGPPAYVPKGDGIPADIFMDFANGNYWNVTPGGLTITRTQTNASTTDLLSSSASGASYQTFASANTLRVTAGLGLLIEWATTNFLKTSNAPTTQTTGSLAIGSYILWVNGAGSAATTAGTAVGTGFGTATQGTPNTFSVTTAGTVTVTVTGALNAFQLEATTNSATGSSLLVTGAAQGSRTADSIVVTAPPVFGTSVSILAKVISYDVVPTNRQSMDIGDGSTANRVGAVTNAGTARPLVSANSVNILVTSAGAVSNGTAFKIAVAHSSTDNGASLNGAAAVSNSTAGAFSAVPTIIALGRSNNVSNNQLNGYLSNFAVWLTTRVSNAALATITT